MPSAGETNVNDRIQRVNERVERLEQRLRWQTRSVIGVGVPVVGEYRERNILKPCSTYDQFVGHRGAEDGARLCH